MSKIKTWGERCEDEFGDMHVTTSADVQAKMQSEIDDLRDALAEAHDLLRAVHDALDGYQQLGGIVPALWKKKIAAVVKGPK